MISKIPTNIRAEIAGGEKYDFIVRRQRHRALRPRDRSPKERSRRVMRSPIVAASVDSKVPGWLGRMADSEHWLWRLMLAPAILYIVLLVGFPFLLSLYYSLSDATVASREMHFVGLENFRRVVGNETFWVAVENTVVFTLISQVLVLVFANVLAMALLADFRGKWLVRLLILLPWVAPISLGSVGWLWIFDSIYSVINWTLRAAHLLGPDQWPIWLGEPDLAMASIITVQVWRMLPLATVIILAGLSSIPQDHSRCSSGGWGRILAAPVRDHAPARHAGRPGGAPVRDRLYVHRFDRGFRPDARRSLRHDASARELGLFHRHPRRGPGGGRRDLVVPVTGSGGGCDRILAVPLAARR